MRINSYSFLHNNVISLSVKGRFSFFSQEGWKNFRLGASHMQYAILDLWKRHEMANQRAPGGWSKILMGLSTFLEGYKKNLGGFIPLENPPMLSVIKSNFIVISATFWEIHQKHMISDWSISSFWCIFWVASIYLWICNLQNSPGRISPTKR